MAASVVPSWTFFCETCQEHRTFWDRDGARPSEWAKRRLLAERWKETAAGFRCLWCLTKEQVAAQEKILRQDPVNDWMFEPLPLPKSWTRTRKRQAQRVSPSVLVKSGKGLKEAREARHLTQEEVARQIGIARTTLVAIEQGKRPIRPLELQALARVYDLPSHEEMRQK